MYKVVYYRGESKTVGKENWTKFEQRMSETEDVNHFLRRELIFDKNLFQTFIAAIDVYKDEEVIAYGRISYSNESDNHKSCLWEGKDLEGNSFSFVREGSDIVKVQTPFLIGENLV